MPTHPYTRLYISTIAAPSVDEDGDAGFEVGDIWIYDGQSYQAVDVSTGAAVWEQITGAGTIPDESILPIKLHSDFWDAIASDISNSAIPHNGWILKSAWTRTGNHTFTVDGNATAIYRKGAKIRCHDSGGGDYKQGVIGSSSFGGVTTTVNLIPNTDFVLAAGALTDPQISYVENPEGFPHWFNAAVTITSTTGTITTVSTNSCKWSAVGRNFTIMIDFTVTTNGTGATSITCTLGVTPAGLLLGVGRNITSGAQLSIAGINGLGAILRVTTYTGAYPVTSGDTCRIMGSCEF